jgi:hypothetical protein
MKTLSLITFGALVAVLSNIVSLSANDQSANWAEQAISPNQSVAQQAQDHLREAGPRGLQMLEQRFANEIAAHRKGAASDERWKRIGAALDRVGGQYDNYASGLYWYTDLEKAKTAARASGRPILSLRLLGRLDEDLSCANSRFFRTTLYPSREINQLLKDGFILHWESVRPAPRVTIAFGDGRKLERTITGNSIHYLLDADGKVVDALPGLYSAPAFAAELRQLTGVVKETQANGIANYAEHMKSTEARLLKSWTADLAAIHVALPANQPVTEQNLELLMDDSKWQQVAQRHLNVIYFDGSARELMARKLPVAQKIVSIAPDNSTPPPAKIDARIAGRVAVSKGMVEMPMLRTLTKLTTTVALDTVRNNYMLRARILEFLVSRNARAMSLDQINDWIYARVFLTPRQDPWLGLAPQDVFTAIEGNGETSSSR